MIRKDFRLEQSDIEIINEIKSEMGLRNESDALRYIIRNFKVQSKSDGRIVIATMRKIEERVDLLLDIANTDLINRKEDTLYPVDMVESPVIQKARELRRQKLAHKKQRSDFRKKKR